MEILIGQDSASLLLTKEQSNAPQPRDCEFYQDISIQSSPAAKLLSIVGAIGEGNSVEGDGRNFKVTQQQSMRANPRGSKIQSGNFIFNSNPEIDDIQLIEKLYTKCTILKCGPKHHA